MTQRQKILIVDDRESNLLVLNQVLQECDAEVIEASNGNEALAATLDHDFSLAILDVHMPGMDGFEVANYLRGDPITQHIPVIFLSAVYDQKHHVALGYQSGAIDYLTKPFDAGILLAKVRILLDLDRNRRELKAQQEKLDEVVNKRVEEISQLNGILECTHEIHRAMLRAANESELIRAVCDTIVRASRFHNAWIILTHRMPDHLEAAHCNAGNQRFADLMGQFLRGDRPECLKGDSEESRIVALDDLGDLCDSCPIGAFRTGRGALIASLVHEGQTLGWFQVGMEGDRQPSEAERKLFERFASDLAFTIGTLSDSPQS